MYPMTLMCLSPLSGLSMASLPHVLESSGLPPVPRPILESHEKQLFWLLPTIPILNILPNKRHWTLLCRSCAVMSLANLSTLSTCHDPVRCCGIAHQRSVSTESQLACGWQWTWAVGRSSYRDRSWRRMCSSRWVALIPVRRTQFLLRQGWILYNYSSKVHYSEKWSKED